MEVYAGANTIYELRAFPIDLVGFNYNLNSNWKLRSSITGYHLENLSPAYTIYEKETSSYLELSAGIQRDLLTVDQRRISPYAVFDLSYSRSIDKKYYTTANLPGTTKTFGYMAVLGTGIGYWLTWRIAINIEYLLALRWQASRYYDRFNNTSLADRYSYFRYDGLRNGRAAITIKFRLK